MFVEQKVGCYVVRYLPLSVWTCGPVRTASFLRMLVLIPPSCMAYQVCSINSSPANPSRGLGALRVHQSCKPAAFQTDSNCVLDLSHPTPGISILTRSKGAAP